MIANIANPEVILIVVIVGVVLFGGSAIPKLARNLGSAKTEFEKGLKDAKSKTANDAPADDTTAK